MGNDISCKVVGIGSIRIKMFDGIVKILIDVRHVHELRKNLISWRVLDTGGYKSIVQGGVMKVYKEILLVVKEKNVGNMFMLEGRTESDHATTVSENDSDFFQLWHQQLGHMREQGLKVLSYRKLLPSLKSLKLDLCKHCIYGKQNRQRFKTRRHTSEGILDYIDSDVWGPSPTVSYGGSSYFVTFIDDFSRKVWIYMLKIKANVFTVFKQFRDLVEKSIGRSIKYLRTHNGGEFMSMEFENYCKEFGIDRHKTIAYTPQQNGVVEHMNKTLLEREMTMLSNTNLQ
jgi:hypothetical protein